MKKKGIKIIIIIGISLLVIGLLIGGIYILGKDENTEIIDKPLNEVTMEDFLGTKIEIEVIGFNYPEYDLNSDKIYNNYVKPKYPKIKIINETDYSVKGNVISIEKEKISDLMSKREVVDLKPFIENAVFGFTSQKENNLNSFYMEYVYRLNGTENIYALPEYVNLPSIIYNSMLSEILDVTVPGKWSDLALVKGELSSFQDYGNHLVAGYDKENFDIVQTFIMQGYDSETARFIVESWEERRILKGYDQSNIHELKDDMPFIFIMPNSETITALGEISGFYQIGGMLMDDNEKLYINIKDGKHGNYLSVIKGDNIYEDIASWLYLKESMDTEYYKQITLKPYLEKNLTINNKDSYNYKMLQLLSVYEKMYEKEQIIFYE